MEFKHITIAFPSSNNEGLHSTGSTVLTAQNVDDVEFRDTLHENIVEQWNVKYIPGVDKINQKIRTEIYLYRLTKPVSCISPYF